MKTADTKLYTSVDTYFKGPDGMKNEVTMWYIAGGLLIQELAIKKGYGPFGGLGAPNGNITLSKPEILDVCSGPGNFLHHIQLVYPNFFGTCADLNPIFVEAGKELFRSWTWHLGDVTKIQLGKKFDVITASSAYHHIPDEGKGAFITNLVEHLHDDGFILVCDNFLPNYTTESERVYAVDTYYQELINYYKAGNATKDSIDAIGEVYELEKSNVEEHKTSFKIFEKYLESAGLEIFQDVVVWQPDSLKPDNAGSHVMVVKKCKYN